VIGNLGFCFKNAVGWVCLTWLHLELVTSGLWIQTLTGCLAKNVLILLSSWIKWLQSIWYVINNFKNTYFEGKFNILIQNGLPKSSSHNSSPQFYIQYISTPSGLSGGSLIMWIHVASSLHLSGTQRKSRLASKSERK
jgi:hypothetical protein